MSPLSVTVSDAAKLIGCGRNKVYELLASQELKSRRLGRRQYVLVSSIEAMLEGDNDDRPAE